MLNQLIVPEHCSSIRSCMWVCTYVYIFLHVQYYTTSIDARGCGGLYIDHRVTLLTVKAFLYGS